jgi:hypothetical protein
LKLDEEKLTHAGLAQQIGFDPVFFDSGGWSMAQQKMAT